MKQFFFVSGLLLVFVSLLTSCLKNNEDEVTFYDDAAITSFSLGTMYRYYHPASAPDSTVRATVTGSNYPMTIDHLGRKIYNQDSLPVGTVPHVLCTIGTKNSGVLGLQSLGTDTTYHYFVESDSVDFTTKRMFRVVSTDGTVVRDYEVSLNIAQSSSNAFAWTAGEAVGMPAADPSACSVVLLGGKPKMVAGNMVVKDSLAYALASQKLMRSKDAETWEEAAGATDVKQLLGAATKELFALAADGSLLVLRDGSTQWTTEILDDKTTLLPSMGMACTSFTYAPSNNTDYVLLAGSRVDTLATEPLQTDTVTTLWRKISFYGEAPEKSQWVYMDIDPKNRYQLPCQKQLSMVAVDGKVLAVGSNMTIYESRDQGITWVKSETYVMPATVTGTAAWLAKDDESQTLWLLTSSGQAWHGKL